MKNLEKSALLIVLTIALSACNNGPKVIEPSTESPSTESSSGIFTPNPEIQVSTSENSSFGEDLHKVVVEDVLPTDRYIYLNVKEDNDRRFWIAARKQDVKKGEVYFYRRPLLKTNFESKEYNRVFDTIYLVSNLVAEDHSKHVGDLNTNIPQMASTDSQKEDIPTHTDNVVSHKGTLKIADLVKDPGAYEGHKVQISGTCVKVNPNIMKRNWLHIQDGSKNDFDLVVTSDSFVPEGSKVTLRATVSLNRDFGAGYTYDLILENGTLIK